MFKYNHIFFVHIRNFLWFLLANDEAEQPRVLGVCSSGLLCVKLYLKFSLSILLFEVNLSFQL